MDDLEGVFVDGGGRDFEARTGAVIIVSGAGDFVGGVVKSKSTVDVSGEISRAAVNVSIDEGGFVGFGVTGGDGVADGADLVAFARVVGKSERAAVTNGAFGATADAGGISGDEGVWREDAVVIIGKPEAGAAGKAFDDAARNDSEFAPRTKVAFGVVGLLEMVGVLAGERALGAGAGGDIAASVNVAAPDFEAGLFGDDVANRCGIGPVVVALGVLPVFVVTAGGGVNGGTQANLSAGGDVGDVDGGLFADGIIAGFAGVHLADGDVEFAALGGVGGGFVGGLVVNMKTSVVFAGVVADANFKTPTRVADGSGVFATIIRRVSGDGVLFGIDGIVITNLFRLAGVEDGGFGGGGNRGGVFEVVGDTGVRDSGLGGGLDVGAVKAALLVVGVVVMDGDAISVKNYLVGSGFNGGVGVGEGLLVDTLAGVGGGDCDGGGSVSFLVGGADGVSLVGDESVAGEIVFALLDGKSVVPVVAGVGVK